MVLEEMLNERFSKADIKDPLRRRCKENMENTYKKFQGLSIT